MVAVGCADANAARRPKNSDRDFQRLWERSKPDFNVKAISQENNPQKQGGVGAEQFVNPDRKVPKEKQRPRKTRGSSVSPKLLLGPDAQQSQQAVCRSECGLERQGCDQGRNSYQNRSDQLQAAQSSCYLAVQGCLARC